MAYLGQTAHESTLANRVTDTMTGDGSDTTLTLSSAPISVNNVIVFIDGVMQRPTTDYTVSGTTLTFAAAPHNTAKVQAIIGGGEHIGIPLAPITEDQLVDGVVTSAKLESGIQIPASKITSLAASKITGALPALDGSSLTGMSPDGVGIDNVTTNPSPTTNPSGGVGTIHLNKTTGEMFVCTNATANNNVWFNVGEGSGDISNAAPTNPTSTSSFPDLNKNQSNTFTFSGATDADGSVTHYMVDQISNAVLTVTAAEVAAGSAHTFITGNVGSDTAVTFRVRSKDNDGAYSSGVTVSMNVLAIVYTTATGGSITTVGDYKVHTFNSSASGANGFNVSQVGTDATIDYLVVAGGGAGGGTSHSAMSGGGGAGGYRNSYSSETSGGGGSSESALTVTATTYSITVGAGGSGGSASTSVGISGGNSTFSSITSTGGGGGGATGINGATGGSGGGAGAYTPSSSPGAGTSNQGYAGGTGYEPVWYGAGGGGGAGAVGVNGTSSHGGTGGVGLASSITGSSVIRAGGGGGGTYNLNATPGAGGSGGGGAGNQNGAPTAATANTGGGGGGVGCTSGNFAGGNGGSGVIIVRYKFQN